MKRLVNSTHSVRLHVLSKEKQLTGLPWECHNRICTEPSEKVSVIGFILSENGQ